MSEKSSSRQRPGATRTATTPAATRGARASRTSTADDTPDYPGKRFGLPQAGPMSVAPMGRRFIALIIDWVLCELIVAAILRHPLAAGASDPHYFATQYWTLLAFGLEVWLLTAISGLTIGKRLMSIRTIRTDGERPGFGWALLRTALIFCVIPPCVADRDLRGLHDRAADTIVVRI